MEVIVGKTAGFCFGVQNAVVKTEELLDKEEIIYCLGELVHNSQVMDRLCRKGLKVIDDIKKADSKVIIRAHGVPPKIYEEASGSGVELVDFTCPKVAKIHEKAKSYVENNFYIFIFGAKEHPEIIGTYGFCEGKASVIETKEDIEKAIEEFSKSKLQNLAIISQTTFSAQKFNELVEEVEEKIFSGNKGVYSIKLKIDNTICNTTFERQKEAEILSKTVELMIIIGGKNSSNTKKLYEVSSKYCNNVILIETAKELDISNIKNYNKIGIMAGASTPKESIDEVVEVLNGNSK